MVKIREKIIGLGSLAESKNPPEHFFLRSASGPIFLEVFGKNKFQFVEY